MKKISLLTLTLITILMVSTASASNGYGWLTYDNTFNDEVGQVRVEQTLIGDEVYLVVTYKTFNDWYLTETNLHVAPLGPEGNFDEGIPQNKKGNPRIGHFDYSDENAVQSEPTLVKYIVPKPEGSALCIAAHAVLERIEYDEGIPYVREETGWGWCWYPHGGLFHPEANRKGSWAAYMIYYPPALPTPQDC